MSDLLQNGPVVGLLIAVNVLLAGCLTAWVNARFNHFDKRMDEFSHLTERLASLETLVDERTSSLKDDTKALERRIDRISGPHGNPGGGDA